MFSIFDIYFEQKDIGKARIKCNTQCWYKNIIYVVVCSWNLTTLNKTLWTYALQVHMLKNFFFASFVLWLLLSNAPYIFFFLPFNSIHQFFPPPHTSSGKHQPVLSVSINVLLFYIREIILYLPFSIFHISLHISLSTIPSRFVHVATNGKISLFFTIE